MYSILQIQTYWPSFWKLGSREYEQAGMVGRGVGVGVGVDADGRVGVGVGVDIGGNVEVGVAPAQVAPIPCSL